jgi:hypothetical protein
MKFPIRHWRKVVGHKVRGNAAYYLKKRRKEGLLIRDERAASPFSGPATFLLWRRRVSGTACLHGVCGVGWGRKSERGRLGVCGNQAYDGGK